MHLLANTCPPALACCSSPPPGVEFYFLFLQHESICHLSGSSPRLYQWVFSVCSGNPVSSSVLAPRIFRYPEKSWKRMNSWIFLLVVKSFHTLPWPPSSLFLFFFFFGKHLVSLQPFSGLPALTVIYQPLRLKLRWKVWALFWSCPFLIFLRW